MSWNKVPIKTICKGIYDGPHATPPESSSGAVFLGIPNFINGQLDLSNIRYISEQDLPKWTKRVTPRPNDIVFSYEATLNLYAIIPKGFWGCLGRRMALIRVDERKADYKFLYYYFYSTAWRSVIQEHTVTGATVDRIPLVSFPDFLVELPDLPTQRRIASILSAYDDLIENNRRQIKLLEEAAQRLYREWFVELRFPGHEGVKVVDGVPEGWKRVKIKDLIAYEIGGGWGSDAPSERDFQEAYVIRGTDLHGIMHGDYKNIPLRFHSENSLKPRILQDGDIVFEVSGGGKNEGVARTALISTQLLSLLNKPAICASFCKLIRPIEIDYSQYMYSYLQFLRASGKTAEYDKRSASSIVNYRWKDFLVQEYTLLPELTVLKHFNRYIDAYYKKITTCANIISIASDTRDRLLSKLMSREMEV